MKVSENTEHKNSCSAVAHNLTEFSSSRHPVVDTIQTSLTIGQPGDKYEQEADRFADQVMSITKSSIQQQPLEEEEEMVQPKIQMQEEEEEEVHTKPLLQMQAEEEEEMLQTKPIVQLQAFEEEEEIQTKPLLQMQPAEEEMSQPKWIQQKNNESGISQMIQRYDWGMHDVPGMGEERERQCPEWTEATHEATGALVGEIRARHSDDWLLCFAEIHSRRNRLENCCNLNYAAADHYFWLRLEVGSGNWSYSFATAVIGLGIIGRIIIGERGPRSGNCPTSPFSTVVTSWEYLGALRGRQDAQSRAEASDE